MTTYRPAIAASVAAGVVAIVAAACWQHWHVLGASPFPIGIDGYFYPIEVRSILEHGTLRYPASPLAFYWMAPFAAATDPIVGAKLGAALGCALIAVPAYGVGARLGGGSRGAGLIAAAIAALSAGSGFLAIEFVKQGIGLAVALAALWVVLVAVERPTARWITGAIAALALALATHKLAGALVVVVAAPVVLVRVRHRLRGRRLIYAVLAAGGLGLALVVLGLVAPQRFVAPHDLALLGDLAAGTARWSAPALVMPDRTLAFGHEALAGGCVALVAMAALVATRGQGSGRPGDRWGRDRWGRRRWTRPRGRRRRRPRCSPDPARPASPPRPAPVRGCSSGSGWRSRSRGSRSPIRRASGSGCGSPRSCRSRCARRCARASSRAGCALAARDRARARRDSRARSSRSSSRPHRTEGEVLTHPALAAAVIAAEGRIPAGATVIVPERHILFMVDWYTRAPVSLRPEPVPYAERVRLFGLAFIGGPDAPLDHALDAARTAAATDEAAAITPPLGLHAGHRNGLVLVTEPTWDWLLAHLPPASRAYFAAWPTI